MSATTTQAGSFDALRPRADRGPVLGPLLAVLKFMRRKPLGAVGLSIVMILFLAAIFANWIAPQSYEKQSIRERFQQPSGRHWLGTDDLGRDTFSRIIYGARVSVLIGFGVVLIAGFLSGLLGVLTGFYGGMLDLVVQRFVDILISFPALILLITFTSMFPKPEGSLDIGPLALDPSVQRGLYIVIALGILFSFGASRVVRGAVISIKNNQYIEGARAIGATDTHILFRYILPNIFPTLLILSTVQLGGAILAESSLSFLGFGFNMLGDALRDVLDPRLRGSR